MKSAVKRLMERSSLGRRLLQSYRRHKARRSYGAEDLQSVFNSHFEKNFWGDAESVSGPGSTLEYTENLRAQLPELLTRLGVKRMLDAPCGDYNWFRLVTRPGVTYVGGDIVPQLVQRNTERHRSSTTEFLHLDITRDSLPQADLWMCRDCLFHLPEDAIFAALENFARSEIPWLLTSTHHKCAENSDIMAGSFRELNLQLPPYSLPPPRVQIDDWVPPHPQRVMALWSREEVAAALKQNKRGSAAA